jgi:DNA-binding response OmpR family regulator
MHAATEPPHLLIVEDETHIRELVCGHLDSEGYRCATAANGPRALELLQSRPFALVVLDVMLPGVSGLEICRRLRSSDANRDVPILMLSARGEEADKLAGFQGGADDYLTKPFSMLELSARVAALLRRARGTAPWSAEKPDAIEVGGIRLDPAARTLQLRGRDVPVTKHEFRLLYRMASEPGVVFSREQLLAEVWQGEVFVTGRSVDTLVYRLRCKLERDPAQPTVILTVWGEGYKLAVA